MSDRRVENPKAKEAKEVKEEKEAKEAKGERERSSHQRFASLACKNKDQQEERQHRAAGCGCTHICTQRSFADTPHSTLATATPGTDPFWTLRRAFVGRGRGRRPYCPTENAVRRMSSTTNQAWAGDRRLGLPWELWRGRAERREAETTQTGAV
ncbi:uncharacterized protein SPSK_04631 [Sporothrix schenckii 1099-18]|uniref:Uncharacterized protein n=1 Tax=Sporothrix schenckii 1099-18 TaxID=1397361 RepID=A0A0F2M2C4_SPOSC|nr:uncharacterized protein SPSK_04631 [Sporothrix schenckii 1099-18]KJR83857.1 hypothetical protein SPSK_04631 [Sporothrix schenckii 1099-18]